MRPFVIRLILIFFTTGLLYRKTTLTNILAALSFIMACVLSYRGLTCAFRDKILGLLADKILLASVLIVFTDLRVLSSAVVAWVIGGLFVYSGIDLLQGSLRTSAPSQSEAGSKGVNFRATWINHLVQMGLVLALLILISFRHDVSSAVYAKILMIISYAWVILTAFLITRCLLSERFRELSKEA